MTTEKLPNKSTRGSAGWTPEQKRRFEEWNKTSSQDFVDDLNARTKYSLTLEELNTMTPAEIEAMDEKTRVEVLKVNARQKRERLKMTESKAQKVKRAAAHLLKKQAARHRAKTSQASTANKPTPRPLMKRFKTFEEYDEAMGFWRSRIRAQGLAGVKKTDHSKDSQESMEPRTFSRWGYTVLGKER